LTVPEAVRVMSSIFQDIRACDVRQRAGQTQYNAGEIRPSGIEAILRAVGPLHNGDVFLDVGAGIGNVLAQVALTTNVRRCIGVDVWEELCVLAAKNIHRNADAYPLLRKVSVVAAEVQNVLLSTQSPTADATIVYTNYFLFEESAKLYMAQKLSAMPNARVVASTSRFCPRHRASCSQPFCSRWNFERELKVACSWKSSLVSLYIYKSKSISFL
ncbi:Histone methylation protein, partial [Phytophthora megakarya]